MEAGHLGRHLRAGVLCATCERGAARRDHSAELLAVEAGARVERVDAWENGYALGNVSNLLVRGWLAEASRARVAEHRARAEHRRAFRDRAAMMRARGAGRVMAPEAGR
jgi:hypothetical protein